MAKVSTHTITVYHEDIHKEFKIGVLYNSDNGFHVEVPDNFREVCKHLSYDERQKKNIVTVYKTKRDQVFYNDNFKFYIKGITEQEVINNTISCFKFLITKSIVQRDVIIVFFNPKDNCLYNEHLHNKEHPQIGMQFGLTYAVESTVGENKVYSIYPEGGYRNGVTIQNRKEIRLRGDYSTIIPDTPENRITLETIYKGFITLNEKLKDITKTPDVLLEFIQSNQKLIG